MIKNAVFKIKHGILQQINDYDVEGNIRVLFI